jgi:hypothetical protein
MLWARTVCGMRREQGTARAVRINAAGHQRRAIATVVAGVLSTALRPWLHGRRRLGGFPVIRTRNLIKKTRAIKSRRNNMRAFARRRSGRFRIEINATPRRGIATAQRAPQTSSRNGKTLFSAGFPQYPQRRAATPHLCRVHSGANRSPRARNAFDIFNSERIASRATTLREQKSPGFRRGFRCDRSR